MRTLEAVAWIVSCGARARGYIERLRFATIIDVERRVQALVVEAHRLQ